MESSISVAVRVRPWSEKEAAQLSATYNVGPQLFGSDQSTSTSTPQPPPRASSGALRKVLKVLDDRILVFDPPETNAVASFHRANFPAMGKKVKDIRFCFDKVFDDDCGQEEVYDGSARELVGHVMNGFHSTVFAYGATGCGKTHTISGTQSQPGIVFLIMKDLFARIAAKSGESDFSLKVSYLEIYNETIRDLLAPESGPLQLRESNGTATPAGLSSKEPTCASDVVEWITLGNQNRTVNATEANATSSRSHAVLSVTVTQKPKAGGMTDNTQSASLSVIDLAGSERASVTKNKGDRLIEGANINRSLLALGNCINALCDPRKRGHVPYRDSKLTRLLKQSLGGNCKTVMIVCVSPSSAHYDETHNTLQYANRAKEIKTKAVRNVISIDRHVGQYCQQIMEQAARIQELEALVARKDVAGGVERFDAGVRAVENARVKLLRPWEERRDLLVKRERAQVEKDGLENILDVLKQWRSAAFKAVDAALEDPSTSTDTSAAQKTVTVVKSGCDRLISSLSAAVAHHDRAVSETASSASLDQYTSALAMHNTSIRTSHPQAFAQFQLEVKLLDCRLDGLIGDARERAIAESSQTQARAMNGMFEAKIQVAEALDAAREDDHLRRFAKAIDTASRGAFIALTATKDSSHAGTKRDAGSRSPLEPENVWAKSPRRAVAGIGSAPTGTHASPPKFNFNRQSPRKAVSFSKARRDGGRGTSASPKKRKGVQWRDEVGDGDAALEDYTSTPDTSMGTPTGFAGKTPMPSVAIWGPDKPWAPTPQSINAAQRMTHSIKQRQAAGTGSLRSRASSSRLGLPSLAESGSPAFTFLRDDPSLSTPSTTSSSSSLSRAPFSDLANTSASSSESVSPSSFSMAGPSGLFAPLISAPSNPAEPETPRRAAARARRVSQIGPQRSVKPNRRTSFVPPPPAPSLAQGGARKASRGTSSMFAPPTSSRKSTTPRKAPASAVGRIAGTLPRVSSSSSIGGNSSFSSASGERRGSPGPGSTQPAKSLWR
ncbi:hypothetical protein RQP46_006035 [Phenoliferia psychrophenolica]